MQINWPWSKKIEPRYLPEGIVIIRSIAGKLFCRLDEAGKLHYLGTKWPPPLKEETK